MTNTNISRQGNGAARLELAEQFGAWGRSVYGLARRLGAARPPLSTTGGG
jgi:hypothetical protein